MAKKLGLLAVVSLVVIVLDQITKNYVHSNFALHESYVVIDGFFNFTYVRNPGAAFGFLQGAPRFFRENFFLILTPVALVGISYFLTTTKENDYLQNTALSLVFAGAIGNYIDRLRFSYVIDFLDFYIGSSHYPAFNVADSAIVVGVCTLLLHSFLEGKKDAA